MPCGEGLRERSAAGRLAAPFPSTLPPCSPKTINLMHLSLPTSTPEELQYTLRPQSVLLASRCVAAVHYRRQRYTQFTPKSRVNGEKEIRSKAHTPQEIYTRRRGPAARPQLPRKVSHRPSPSTSTSAHLEHLHCGTHATRHHLLCVVKLFSGAESGAHGAVLRGLPHQRRPLCCERSHGLHRRQQRHCTRHH